METTVLTRDDLHKQIWTSPIRTVAKRYGISDVSLAKICHRHHIPVPGRGHWAKVRAGHRVRRPRLPQLKAPNSDEIVITPTVRRSKPEPETTPFRITVRTRLANPHPLVAHAATVFRGARPNPGHVLQPSPGGPHLDLRVTRHTLGRALRIMDALVKTLELRHYDVTVSEHTTVTVAGEDLHLALEERIAIQRRPYEPAEWPRPQPVIHATGRLILKLTNVDSLGVRRVWSDGKRQRVEDILHKVVVGLEVAATAVREERERWEARRREWEEEARRQDEQARVRRLEKRRGEVAEGQCQRWVTAMQLRQYADTLRRTERIMLPNDLGFSTIIEWREWISSYADAIDPIVVSPDKDS